MSKDEMKHEKWFLKNQYIVGLPKKMGTWTVCRFKGRGARQEREGNGVTTNAHYGG